MPGTIVRALRDAGSRNPVFMIDEIDKMGADFRGDPPRRCSRSSTRRRTTRSATTTSTSPFDLSEVMFIATANMLDTIPRPLQDRMEVIQLAGYTLEEKRHIAKRYLVPRQIEANGLKPSQIEFADAGADGDHRGVHARGRGPQPRARDRDGLPQGRPRGRRGQGRRQGHGLRPSGPASCSARRFFAEQRRRTRHPGVATGLAWTPTGGDVLFIEATACPARAS